MVFLNKYLFGKLRNHWGSWLNIFYCKLMFTLFDVVETHKQYKHCKSKYYNSIFNWDAFYLVLVFN